MSFLNWTSVEYLTVFIKIKVVVEAVRSLAHKIYTLTYTSSSSDFLVTSLGRQNYTITRRGSSRTILLVCLAIYKYCYQHKLLLW